MVLKPEYKAKLEEWLRINKEQWEQLGAHGVVDGTELELDYNFVAPDEAAAEAFCKALGEKFNYQSKVVLLPEDDQGNPAAWVVHGTTEPTKSGLDFLDGWVTKLVEFGAERSCMFEGWGAYPPNVKQQFSLAIGGFENDPEIEAEFPKLIHVTIPESVEPKDRWDKYEGPLSEMLEDEGLGKIARAGSLLDITEDGLKIRGIEFVIHVAEAAPAMELVKSFLETLGASQVAVKETSKEELSS